MDDVADVLARLPLVRPNLVTPPGVSQCDDEQGTTIGAAVELVDVGGRTMAHHRAGNGPPLVLLAVDWACRLNDYAATQVEQRPDRFASFAALPMQDPDAATTELHRAVTELGLVGALINGFSQVGDEHTIVYLDDPRYAEFWATLEELDVPVYLHPRDPLEHNSPQYQGHPWLYGSAWAFSVETATHALRLMGSGLFDRHPRTKVILGHLGELLPFNIWRTDHRLAVAPRGLSVRHSFGHYLRTNFWLTTSGNFRTPALVNTILEVGADRVLFSADYPFEDMREAATWFDGLELNDSDHVKIAQTNAQQLLRL